LWKSAISLDDLRTDLVTPTAINKPFETKPHRLGSTRNDPSYNELIDSRRKVVVYPSYQLSHAGSIDMRNALCNAHSNA